MGGEWNLKEVLMMEWREVVLDRIMIICVNLEIGKFEFVNGN